MESSGTSAVAVSPDKRVSRHLRRNVGHSEIDTKWSIPVAAANTGISPLRCASVEMTMLCWCEEQATTEARLLGERVERGAGVGGVAGPSTASLRLALLAQGLRSG